MADFEDSILDSLSKIVDCIVETRLYRSSCLEQKPTPRRLISGLETSDGRHPIGQIGGLLCSRAGTVRTIIVRRHTDVSQVYRS